jgi:hypothetical protein
MPGARRTIDDEGAMVVTEAPVVARRGRGVVADGGVGAPCRSRPCIPTEIRRRGRVLLNQQCWLWGQDIRRPDGNALIEYGFARTRPPAGEKGSNTYALRSTGGETVLLWAFGLFFHRPGTGGVFIPRFGFSPRVARFDGLPGEVWGATQLSNCSPPRGAREWARAHRLFIPALRWVAGYEGWIVGRRGLDYRRACVESWPKVRVAADGLAGEWDRLIADCDAAMRAFIAARAVA